MGRRGLQAGGKHLPFRYIVAAYSPQAQKQLLFIDNTLNKRERKSNYSVDGYFKDTLRAGPSKTDKAPKLPRAPKQVQM